MSWYLRVWIVLFLMNWGWGGLLGVCCWSRLCCWFIFLVMVIVVFKFFILYFYFVLGIILLVESSSSSLVFIVRFYVRCNLILFFSLILVGLSCGFVGCCKRWSCVIVCVVVILVVESLKILMDCDDCVV